nr:membrane hypothetical protein [Rhizobiaceae bacterium]
MLALVVDEGTHAAPLVAGDDDLARPQRTRLHENGGDGAATAIELGFDDDTFRGAVRVGLEVEDFGLQQDRFQELVEVRAVLGRDFHVERFTAHGFDEDLVLEQLRADTLDVCGRLVDLVDRHDDRDACRLGVVDGLDRLRHHAVVGRDHQDRDIRRLCAAGTHRGERCVAGGVDEGDLVAVLLDLVGADMLCDAAGFASDNVGMPDGVEQRGLAVVDVAHDGHDRRTRFQIALVVGNVEDTFLDVGFGDALDGMAEFAGDEFGQVGVDQIAGLHHLAFLHQVLDDVDGAFGHALRQFLNGDGLRQHDLARNLLARLLHHGALELLLATAHGRERAAALCAVLVGRGGRQRQLALAAAVVGLRAGRHLGGLRTGDLAAVDGRTAARALVAVVIGFVAATAGNRRYRRRTGRLRAGFGSGGGNGRLCHRLRDGLFHGGSGRGGLGGAALGLFLLADEACLFLGLAAGFLFHLAAGLVLGALARFGGVADLCFGKRAATGLDLIGGKLVQHHADTRAALLMLLRRRARVLLHGARLLRFGLALLHGRDGRHRPLVFRAVDAALAGLDHDGLRPATTHVLAHGSLLNPRGLQAQGLLASHADRLVVFVVGHSVPFLRSGPDAYHQTPSFNCVPMRFRPAECR